MKLTYQIYENTVPSESRDIRTKVFVEEQGFREEFDTIDDRALHIVIFCDGVPAGTLRMFPAEQEGAYYVGRVAVLPQFRKEHLGSKLMMLAEQEVRRRGGSVIALSAQCRVSGFYESLGYEKSGEVYLDEYCPHIHMEKRL